MINPYTEPELSICVLDFCKPYESRFLLESIRRHIKIPHRIIFCDNGSNEEYPVKFLRDGLIDQLIINKEALWHLHFACLLLLRNLACFYP